MRVAPIPVIVLLPLVGLRVLVGLLVIVVQVDSPGVVLTIVPIVVVLVVAVVDANLDAVVFRHRGSHNCQRGGNRGGQY